MAGYKIKIRYTPESNAAANDIFSILNDRTVLDDSPPFFVEKTEILEQEMLQWGATGFELRYNPGSEDEVAQEIQNIIQTQSREKYSIHLQESTTASPNFISIFLAN